MSDSNGFSIECATCVASATTACSECIVTHLLANDDGPIDLVSVEQVEIAVDAPMTPRQRAIDLFERAGLLDDPVQFVERAEFEAHAPMQSLAVP